MIYLNELQFAERVFDIDSGIEFKGLVPTVVSFHTVTPYCQKMITLIDDVAALHTDINFYGVDVDKQGELVEKLGIRAIPTTMFFPLTSRPAIIGGLFYTHGEIDKILTKIMFPSHIIKV